MTPSLYRYLTLFLVIGLLNGCVATAFRADVTRFHVGLPTIGNSEKAAVQTADTALGETLGHFGQGHLGQGQSFTITSDDPTRAKSLEFAIYANVAAAKLTTLGYHRADSDSAAQLAVVMRYEVGKNREDYSRRCRTSFRTHIGYGYPHYGYGYGYGYGWSYGWGHSLLWSDDICNASYTLYHSTLDLYIHRKTDDKRLFEGRAQSNSRRNDPAKIVPQLIEALFTDFPGTSEETIRVVLPPATQVKQNKPPR